MSGTAVLRNENRVKVARLGTLIEEGIEKGEVNDAIDDCKLSHYFAPIVDEYGCGTYARELRMPKGTVVVGKIHRHSHVNVISQGKVAVLTESGRELFEAPYTFISQAGIQRAVYILEDTVWTTVHLTSNLGEDNLDKIEDEVIAKTFEEIGITIGVEK